MDRIIAVILNWNSLDLTLDCIDSIKKQQGVNCDVLVIDNGSELDPTYAIKKKYNNTHIIRKNQNYGVAGGRNIGIRYAIRKDYSYILLFDNDAYAEPTMLRYLIDAATNYPEGGIFGPKIYIEGRQKIIWRAGCTSWKWTYLHAGSQICSRLFDFIGKPLPSLIDTKRAEGIKDIAQYDEEEPIDFQIGCAQLIRSRVFQQIGILDEEYSPYGSEDIDFCARVNRSGWKIYYIPKAICYHRVQSSFQNSYARTFFNAKHIILLARKNLSRAYMFFLFMPDFFLLTVPLMIFQSVLNNNPTQMNAFIDAIIWHMRDIKKRGLFL